MIVGFAHLLVNTDNIDAAELDWLARGYRRQAYHRQVFNHPSKQSLGRHYHPTHDIMLLKGPDLWPVELLVHGVRSGAGSEPEPDVQGLVPALEPNQQIAWGRDHLSVTIANRQGFVTLLTAGLGFQIVHDSKEIFEFVSRNPQWCCRIKIQAGSVTPVSLDHAGPIGLAFYCRNIDRTAEHLLSLGAVAAGPSFPLSVGGRHMAIQLLRMPNGPILELIDPGKARK